MVARNVNKVIVTQECPTINKHSPRLGRGHMFNVRLYHSAKAGRSKSVNTTALLHVGWVGRTAATRQFKRPYKSDGLPPRGEPILRNCCRSSTQLAIYQFQHFAQSFDRTRNLQTQQKLGPSLGCCDYVSRKLSHGFWNLVFSCGPHDARVGIHVHHNVFVVHVAENSLN